MTLTDVQQRHIVTTLTHVDRILAEVEPLLPDASVVAASAEPATADAARLQTAVAGIRSDLAAALVELGLAARSQDRSPRRITETALQFADIALSELNERDLRGYGAMDAATARSLAGVVARLRQRVQHAQALLREQNPP